MTAPVDWSLARRLGRRFAPSGPDLELGQAREVVAQLRDHAEEAREQVFSITGMHAEPGHSAVVVDRGEWIDSNVAAMAAVLALWPAAQERSDEASAAVRAVGTRTSAVQLGAALGWLSGKVLGQYEALADPGRLLLVAPTIVDVERGLEVNERDFRLWVCLHEETHRVQFGAVPWLGDHFTGLITRALETFDESSFGDRLFAIIGEIFEAFVQRRTPDIIAAAQTEEQRAILDEITGLMSVLEGHADVVMDEVDISVVPTVAQIRNRFEGRRASQAAVRGADSLWRKALGMDAKMAQYREGAAFVRALMDQGGMAMVNQVWQAPENLPNIEEVREPSLWLARMRGIAA
ncbi:MAG: zinc-dependent metalloprotease [Actinomycetota bacterium]|nr:zinc-dependent metalloprotease [Actinomycetota bacterium]